MKNKLSILFGLILAGTFPASFANNNVENIYEVESSQHLEFKMEKSEQESSVSSIKIDEENSEYVKSIIFDPNNPEKQVTKKPSFSLLSLLKYNIAFASSADEVASRRDLVSSLYYVAGTFSLLLGLGLMALGGVKLKRRAENPNDPKSFPAAIIITFVAGALIFNYSGTSSTLIATLLGSDSGHCFVLKEQLTSKAGDIENGVYENCWDSSKSTHLDEIASKVDEMTDGNGSKLKENVEIIVGLFQLIGLIYLIKGIYGLKLTAEGNGRDGYMKPIVTMIAAALVIDLPHTLEMIDETIKLLGFGGGS